MASIIAETDGFRLVAEPNSTPPYGPFKLLGGTYSLDVESISGTSPTVQLQKVYADGNVINVGSQLSAAGETSVNLAPGCYDVLIGGTGSR